MTNNTAATPNAENIADMTPAQIDNLWADLDMACAQLDRRLAALTDHAHYTAGDRRVRSYGHTSWGMTYGEVWAKIEAMVAAGDTTKPFHVAAPRSAAELLDAQTDLETLRRANRREVEPLREEYARRNGWLRYFVVTSSTGHVHSNVYCSHRGSTTYGWMPDYSGAEVDTMIAELGPVMCSKCYPDAPLAFTSKKITKAQAAKRSSTNYIR